MLFLGSLAEAKPYASAPVMKEPVMEVKKNLAVPPVE